LDIEGINALGSLEEEIMDIMWQKNSATVTQVFKEMLSRSVEDEEPSYPTITTTLVRLVKKGLLRQDRTDVAYRYTVTQNYDEYMNSQLHKVVEAMFDTFGVEAVKSAVNQRG